MFAVWLGFLPIGVALEFVERRLGFKKGALESVAFIPYVLLWLYTAARARRWRCPRCNDFFTARSLSWNDFAARCLHCGLGHIMT